MSGPVRRRVRVTGLVQGVCYRDNCRRQAQAAGVAGWVRNLPDGSVEAAFEGAAAAVEQMVGWSRRGPSHARVADVRVTDEAPLGERGFEIR